MQVLQQSGDGKDYLYLGYPLRLTPAELQIVRTLADGGRCDVASLGAGSAATVSVHVCAINKKAQIIGGRRLIKTERGRGYRLCDDI